MYDIGIGTTNKCNFRCAHCYSRSQRTGNLHVDDLKALVENLSIRTVNFGTGENILNPEFVGMVNYLAARHITQSLTSNGFTVMNLSDDTLRLFHDVDISMDFGLPAKNDIFRHKGSSRLARDALDRLSRLNIEASVVCCLSALNFDVIADMLEVSRSFGTNLRINVYKPVNNDSLTLTYGQFWRAIESLLDQALLISCSEPVVASLFRNGQSGGGCPCGRHSFRVTPFGEVKPCVYWDCSDVTIQDLARIGPRALENSEQFRKIRRIPSYCQACEHLGVCGGGCAARRLYSGDFDAPDPYCYIYRRETRAPLSPARAAAKDLVHSGYLCTLIVA